MDKKENHLLLETLAGIELNIEILSIIILWINNLKIVSMLLLFVSLFGTRMKLRKFERYYGEEK